ncbi:MAG: alpha/beta hydrolase [Dehalococcoidia bacterium]|jgi:pimeloyl-ACP methyl ester carboxylesterase|nr:alpha/beta hydrolase [Dehalococcoidia bacterium]
MTLVLVHGNPETAAIWNDLIPLLDDDDVQAVSPPGFGSPLPDNFDATSDAYVEWLAAELSHFNSPVDLLGHDWGGGHVVRLACERPDLIRSWASDILGVFTPEYVWHDRAQVWQTPGAGEEAVAAMVSADPTDTSTRYQSLGMSADIANQVANGVNADMARAILSLYRSAAQPIVGNLFPTLANASARPGLAIIATADPFVGGELLGRKAAEQASADVGILAGEGHWWMCSNPQAGANLINNFLANLDEGN